MCASAWECTANDAIIPPHPTPTPPPHPPHVRENNWVYVIIQFVDNLSEHQKYIEILKQFNILIFKYFPYLKILNIFKY